MYSVVLPRLPQLVEVLVVLAAAVRGVVRVPVVVTALVAEMAHPRRPLELPPAVVVDGQQGLRRQSIR